MQEYRLYTISDERRHYSTGNVRIIHCDDDDEATQAAKCFVDFHDVELWQSGRLVTRLRRMTLKVIE
jgi:hypothetical protein